MKRIYIYPSCQVTRGYSRSIIVDTHKGSYKFIPNALQHMLSRCNGCTVDEITQIFGAENSEAIEQYIEFLVENNFVFITTKPVAFSYDTYRFEHCGGLYDAQIEFDGRIPFELIDELSRVCCQFVHVFASPEASFDSLLELLNVLNTKRINAIYLTLPYTPYFALRTDELWATTVKLLQVIVIGAPQTSAQQRGPNGYQHLYMLDSSQSQCLCCGGVWPRFFAPNAQMIAVTQCYNNCLFGKLYFGLDGIIKPCRYSKLKLGDVLNDGIEKVLKSSKYSDLCGITKDQVDVCRDCEFRRICPDCRVFTRQPERPTAHPARCTYNSNLARWQGQPGYAPVEQCGTFIPQNFQPDAERIERLLRERQELKG